jgi:acetyl esterase
MIHGFLNLVDTLDRSRDAIAVLADDLEAAFGR